jgi:hypothetical protein
MLKIRAQYYGRAQLNRVFGSVKIKTLNVLSIQVTKKCGHWWSGASSGAAYGGASAMENLLTL